MTTYHEELRARVEALRQAVREQLTQLRAEREARAEALRFMLDQARQRRQAVEQERRQAHRDAENQRMNEILNIRRLSYRATHYGPIPIQVEAQVSVGGVLSELFSASTPLSGEAEEGEKSAPPSGDHENGEKSARRGSRRAKPSGEGEPEAESGS
jgi:hypothetical protein